jgi:hypothetical protein
MSNPKPPGDGLISFEPGDVPHVLSQIARLGEGLKAEFDLIAGRMSWLVISESFIFSAFATATASYRPDHPLVGVLRYLDWILPFVGMLLAASVYAAILAALRRLAGRALPVDEEPGEHQPEADHQGDEDGTE